MWEQNIELGATHQICVRCLGLKHAQATFESTMECTHSHILSQRSLSLTVLSDEFVPVMTFAALGSGGGREWS